MSDPSQPDQGDPRAALKQEILLRKLKKSSVARAAVDVIYQDVAIELADRQQPLPLSWAQQRLWFIEQMGALGSAYHIPVALRLSGALNLAALQAALDGIVQRHEILRTRIATVAGVGQQIIADAATARFSLQISDLSTDPAPSSAAQLQQLLTQEAQTPFDLVLGPLIRGRLLRLAADEHVLCVVMHHLVADGWSLAVLTREWGALYTAACQHPQETLAHVLPPLPVQYADYALWQRNELRAAVLQKQLEYWCQRLNHAPARLELPTDHPRPAVQSHAGARVHFSLPPALSIALRALTRHAAVDVTLFMLLQAAWALVLARLSGQDDVVIGVPLANRSHMQLEPLIGFFVNTLALRVQIAPGQSVVELLQTIKAHTLAAYAHQDVPFEQVVEALRPARSLSHSPIFQVMLALQQGAAAEMTLPGLTLASQEIAHTTAQFDLALVLHEKVGAGGTLQGELIYATALFEGHTVARWLAYFTQVLAAMVDDPWQAVEGLSLWDAPARSQYLHEARLRQRRFPAAEEQTLVAAFEAQVAQRAAATALTWEGLSLSYAELNARANRLARYLQTRGLGAEGSADEPRVALCLARGVEMIVGLLAILKAGGAYVPIDPSYPAERIAFLLHDSQAALILTQSDFLALLGSAPQPIIALDREQAAVDRQAAANLEYECALSGQRLAYVIYTSGSTGQPKGVMVEHRQVMRLFAATRAGFQFSADDVWTLFHSYAFDFSVWEIWGALLHGGRLVIVPHLTTRSPDDFYALLCHEQVSVLNQTPMAFRQLMAAQAVAQEDSAFPRHHLRVVIFGGEALDYASLQGWVARNGLDQPQLVNMYGITETTVHVTWHRVNENDLVGGQGCCIGEAIPDLQVYLLDACAQPVPVGVVGEIYVGGAGLARGYWARPELTRERFIRNPLTGDTDARLYRSGDLARWRADGTLDYLGRSDQQVKIRGFRIELGEIEACLRQHPAVHDALVLAYEVQPGDGDGDRRLVAYLVSATAELESVKRHLQARLPEYMQPAAWVQLAALPLTAHGKLDRAALPAPTGYGVQAEHIAYAPPQSELEIRLANIWQKTLGLGTGEAQRRIGRHDDFFELGGHSLLIMRLLENLRQQGIQAQVRQIFSHPTPAALAAALSKTASVFTDSPATPTIPANLIPIEGSAHITPAMLPLLNLTQAQIDQIVARTAGGAANIQDIYPLAPLQEGLLFHHLLDPGHDAYLLPVWMKISATENLDRFVAALQRVIQQHDILRTAIHWEGLPQPVQVVLRQVELPHVWLCSAEHMDAPRLLSVIALQDAPLLRLQSVCDAQTGSCSVLLQFHHIISDHVALEQILDEIRCLLAGMGDALPPPIPYRNHVAQGLAHKLRYAAEVWFRSRLGDLTEPTAPWGLLDVQGDGRAIEEARQSLSAEFSQRLRQLARQQHVSCAALFHVAWALVLARTSGRDDVVFGTVFSGRLQDDPESSRALGLFINTLPLRLQLQGQRIDALVQHVHHELLELLSHEQTPLSLAQACSGLPPPTPLFTALLNYRHGQSRAEPGNQHDFGIQVLALEERTNYPLTLNVDDRGDGFVLEAQVDRRVAATRVLAYMHTALAALLDAVSGMPQKPALTLDVLPTEERHTLLETPNATATAYDLTQPLTFPLNRQAQLTPDAIAVEWGEQTLSYRQLHTRANQLAHHLIQQGIGIDFSPDQVVALYFERSVDMLIAILATLKAGAAYLPLDPHHPRERTQHILNEAQARIILTQHKHAHQLPSTAIPSLSLDAPETHQYLASLSSDPPTTHPQPHHLAYIIYTSGSTGQPKGAMNEHRAVVNRLLWMQDRYRLTPDDRILQKTPYSFDVSVWELLWPLISGARLILAQPNGHQDPAYLQRTIDEAQITTVHFVPSMLQAYLDHLDSHAQEPLRHPQLKRIIVSGEELSVSLHDRCLKTLPHVELHNLYGPTEAAIDVTYHPCQLTDTSHPRTRIPIGKPIANTRIYILDPHGQPVPIGVTGELHIGGTAVGRGYVNRPELTAERFLPDPYSTEPHARMYKSGDLARWNADGEIEYLGRNDQQIKLRGLRIELGEIEAQLRQHTQIKEACVIAQDGKQLIAYYVPNVPNVPTEPPLSPRWERAGERGGSPPRKMRQAKKAIKARSPS